MHYVKGLKGLCFNIRIHVHVVALAAIKEGSGFQCSAGRAINAI